MKGRDCGGLAVLELANNQIGSSGVLELSKVLSSDRNEAIPLHNLKELNISSNPLGSQGIFDLTSALVPRPKTVLINDQSGKNSCLKLLDLSNTNCGAKGAADALKCGAITSLRLFNNSLGSDGFAAITPLLKGGHPSLQSLDLGGNNATDHDMARLLGAIAIVDETFTSTLICVELGGNEVGSEVQDVMKMLEKQHPEIDIALDKPNSHGHS